MAMAEIIPRRSANGRPARSHGHPTSLIDNAMASIVLMILSVAAYLVVTCAEALKKSAAFSNIMDQIEYRVVKRQVPPRAGHLAIHYQDVRLMLATLTRRTRVPRRENSDRYSKREPNKG